FKVFDKIFLLNDAGAAVFFNKKFRTNKFKYLPDPIAVRDFESARNLRNELKIGDTEQVLLHFGGMSGRKGTLEVLQSIEILPQKGYVFIFAGVVGSDIKTEFYARVESSRERGANILVFDEFCSYSFLCDLCKTCDAIVIPYKSTEQSSGVIAYAAALNRPVLAPRSGLLGKIIRKYRLGCLLKEVSAVQIAGAIQNRFWQNLKLNGAEYLRDNELCLFQKIILEE
ncbi:MAG: glycosyltransferase, partial [Porphyromonadaceae bacterium]|nr:glycosyltransferase [Porphyromonadaceae bacterium]